MMDNDRYDIAVVGMACRFPGADDLDGYWHNLLNGVESITRFSDDELIAAGIPREWLKRSNYVKAAPILDDPALFDAAFFDYSPTEARMLDPQHRLLLELAALGLENAACDPERYPGRIGVFAGVAMNTYFMHAGLNAGFAQDYIPILIANDKDFLSTRISYKLNLRGPSLTVQTACSTSLVAIHLARQSLLTEESDVALAGAVSVRVPHRAGYFCDSAGVVSPDGRVRAFDARANGTVFGSGGGVVVLKRIADAVADGDTIYAVLKGSAINNDGSEKVGYTAPSVAGQSNAVLEAIANSGVNAADISYLEAHGSGTPVGDPIEVHALTNAFRCLTRRTGFCGIGSVKTNIGHLDAAAGIAGFIKTALALYRGRIPPSLNYSTPNPEIDLSATPFFVVTQLSKWPERQPRRAVVMSTGMGGTNACVVLEESPAARPRSADDAPCVLTVSAKTATALNSTAQRLGCFLQKETAVELADVAYTLQTGRRQFSHRRAILCARREEAVQALLGGTSQRQIHGVIQNESPGPVVFLLPGVGDHYVNMGHGLYERFAVFRETVDRCATLLKPHLDRDIRELLFSADRKSFNRDQPRGIDLKKMLGVAELDKSDRNTTELNRTIYVQPALFTLEYALCRLWQEFGIQPARIVGHSMGEYVAACLAGVFSLEEALRLIAVRAKLAESLTSGAMLAVTHAEDELLPLLPSGISIALINGPKLCVVAGPEDAMASFEETLKRRDVIYRPVRNAHAFHSRMLEPIVDLFAKELAAVRLSAPRIPFISNATGNWITFQDAVSPRYWAEHAARTARFSAALERVWRLENPVLIEAGPGRTLSALATQHPARPAAARSTLVSSLRHEYENEPDAEVLLGSVGKLWVNGIPVKWERIDSRAERRKLPLPGYTFERQRYWLDPKHESVVNTSAGAMKRNAGIADWFYVPSWERTPWPRLSSFREKAGAVWLIFSNGHPLGLSFERMLRDNGASVHRVSLANSFTEAVAGDAHSRVFNLDDYLDIFRSRVNQTCAAVNIVHLGCIPTEATACATLVVEDQSHGFYSVLNIARAIGELGFSLPVRIGVVVSEMHNVTGLEQLCPEFAPVLGAAGVIPKEYPNVSCFVADVPTANGSATLNRRWVERILSEFAHPSPAAVIAYRGNHRWIKGYKPVSLPEPRQLNDSSKGPGTTLRLRPRGVYLITGGTGGIGLAIAKWLVENCRTRLILTKKTPLPPKSQWRAALASKDCSEKDRDTIESLLDLEALGGEVDVVAGDIADAVQAQHAVQEAFQKYGALNGVLHAAGILRAGLIQLKDQSTVEPVLAPKVRGTVALYRAVQHLDLDFLILFSSLASITMPYAHADYCAANAFLDAFAEYCNGQGRFRCLSINWPMWREVGILANLQAQAGVEDWKQEALARAISTKDGLEVLQRALECEETQIIVSPDPLDRLPGQTAHLPALVRRAEHSPLGLKHPGNDARAVTGYSDEVEQMIGGIWESVLGLEGIGSHERFTDLGGHSLLAMQIVSKIRICYQTAFTLRDFFDGPTIAENSTRIRERLMAEIESLSDNEVKSRLAGT